MGVTIAVLGIFVFLLVAAAVRMELHELCHRFDDQTDSAGGWSRDPYWLTFKSTDGVTYGQEKEAFHDRTANFATLNLAMYYSARVNADRKAKGQPLYTVVHGSNGMEWPIEAVGAPVSPNGA
jgi:hypothetical protein